MLSQSLKSRQDLGVNNSLNKFNQLISKRKMFKDKSQCLYQ